MKAIIIYFSRSGENYTTNGIKDLKIGNTEVLAQYIHEFVGADLFKIETIEDYPIDYYECTEVAKKEFQENARPKLRKYLASLEEYDTIYLGYPNWWGTVPMAIHSCLENLDLNGKNVYPFCTHEGSGFGNSIKDLKEHYPNAKFYSGVAVQGSYVESAKDTLESWLKSCGK